MEFYAIPFEGQYILYRPLPGIAFIGNRAMANHIRRRLRSDDGLVASEVDSFLAAIRFLDPDPPSPPNWLPADLHQPTQAVLLLTNECNLRCTYCYAHGGEGPSRKMPLKLATRAVDAAHDHAHALRRCDYSVAFHGGGEPTLSADVLRGVVDHALGKSLPCRLSVATNGVWSDAMRRFVLEHFANVTLSCDGLPSVQDRQRPRSDGVGSADAVMETVQALDEANMPYGIRMTVTPESMPALADSVAFLCERSRCQSIQVEPCYTASRGAHADPTPVQAKMFIAAFGQAFEVACRAKRLLTYSGARPWAIASCFCRAAEEALIVTPEGDVVVCFETCDRSHPLHGKCVIGHVSSRVVIDVPTLRAFQERQQRRRGDCRGCFCYWHCGGDCLTRCVVSSGTRRVRCLVNRTLTRDLLAWNISQSHGLWRRYSAPRSP